MRRGQQYLCLLNDQRIPYRGCDFQNHGYTLHHSLVYSPGCNDNTGDPRWHISLSESYLTWLYHTPALTFRLSECFQEMQLYIVTLAPRRWHESPCRDWLPTRQQEKKGSKKGRLLCVSQTWKVMFSHTTIHRSISASILSRDNILANK